MAQDRLPPIVEQVTSKYPKVWDAYNQLGMAAAQVGALDPKSERLLKLAISIGGRLEGAVRAHVRRGHALGVTREQMEQVALLAITTIGWPSALAALAWIDDELQKAG
ncbi:MAG: carboxymuconolactone decarboxylase family protein [Pirellulales bacterium]|nr:carboxymuconolactone decarboxylase family protein [Pirellulales bacterium]